MSRLEPNVNIADAIRKCLVSIEQATGIKVQTDLDRASMPWHGFWDLHDMVIVDGPIHKRNDHDVMGPGDFCSSYAAA